jgi:hypothetical protein
MLADSNGIKISCVSCGMWFLDMVCQATKLGVAPRCVWSLDLVAMLLLWPQVTGVG